jgi:hypothetical protein
MTGIRRRPSSCLGNEREAAGALLRGGRLDLEVLHAPFTLMTMAALAVPTLYAHAAAPVLDTSNRSEFVTTDLGSSARAPASGIAAIKASSDHKVANLLTVSHHLALVGVDADLITYGPRPGSHELSKLSIN